MASQEEKEVEKKRLTLKLPVEDIERIKRDAKALGWTPAEYVSRCTRLVNSSAEEVAQEIPIWTKSISQMVQKGLLS